MSVFEGSVVKYVPSEYPPVDSPTPTSYVPDSSVNESSPGAEDGDGIIDQGPSRAVAIDPASQDVYVSHGQVGERQKLVFSGFSGEFKLGNLPAGCSPSETGSITYAGGTAGRNAIRDAARAVCGGSANINASGLPPEVELIFQGGLAGIDFDLISCIPQAGSSGSCTVEPATDGAPSHIAQYEADGTLVTDTIGNNDATANYSGLDVYGATGRIYAFDSPHGQIAVFDSGAEDPAFTFDGTATPAGSIGAPAAAGLAIDQETGHVFLFDHSHHVVDEFKANGDYVTQMTESLVAPQFFGDVAIDNSGTANDGVIYVADKTEVVAFGPMSTEGLSLFVTKNSNGEGTVTGGSETEPNAIECGSICEAEFEPGTEITLTASPEPGSVFVEWTGCDSTEGSEGEICKVTVSANTVVTATFDTSRLTVQKDGNGEGAVTGGSASLPNAIDCGSTCGANFEPVEVTLTAGPSTGSAFEEWTGCDSTEGPEDEICKVVLSEDTTVTATFIKRTLTVSKEGPGAATITSDPAGIDCGATCEGAFFDGEEVTLTASYSSGSKLKTWSVEGSPGACPGAGDCTVTMNADKHVTAYVAAQPSVSETAVSNVGTSTARLEARVNPRGELTTWHFEYVDDAAFQESGFTNATKAPASDPSAGAGTSAGAVLRSISGLSPETLYHFRLVATNYASPVGGTAGEAVSFSTYASPAGFESCSNDSYRTGPSAKLPDCRAYEQASPVDKNGIDVLGRPNAMAASVDGDRVLYYSLNGQPGSSGPQTFPISVAQRGADSWSASGVLPPATYGNKAAITGWLPDLSSVFSGANDLLGISRYFLARDSADGSLRTLSEAGAPTKIVGSSADGSVVYFLSSTSQDTASPLTPDAVPNKPNLYAWNRDTNTLTLAGVLPDSTCGSPPCISSSGSTVQSDYPVADHVVGESGDAYFTDSASKQLYLRKDPFGSPSTVHVSESHRSVQLSPLGATFRTATPDGQHAFFTSPEELTDESNTGPTLYLPAIARADKEDGGNIDGGLVPLGGNEEQNLPTATASDEDHLYWIEPNNNSIGRSDIDGNNAQHEFITGLDHPYGIAVDSEHIYWTNQGDGGAEHGTIGRADLTGCSGEPPCNVDQSFITGATNPKGIDVDAAHVYWSNAGGHIARADLPGGGGVNFEFGGITQADGDVAVDGESLYFSSGTSISRKNLDGSGRRVAVANVSQPGGTRAPALALDGSHLYWTHPSANKLGREPLAGVNESLSTAVDARGDLFVLNRWAGVSVFGPDGKPITATFAPYSGETSSSASSQLPWTHRTTSMWSVIPVSPRAEIRRCASSRAPLQGK